jgi:hypothetical protein
MAVRSPASSASSLTATHPHPQLARVAEASFLDALPAPFPYRLRPRPRVLMLEPGGGLDVLLALENGARSVVAVEDDAALAELKGSRLARQAGGV